MAAKANNSHTPSMVQFVLHQYWTFSEAAFSLARTISTAKILKRDFAPLSDCLKQAKNLMFEESIKETDEFISHGRLNGYESLHSLHYWKIQEGDSNEALWNS